MNQPRLISDTTIALGAAALAALCAASGCVHRESAPRPSPAAAAPAQARTTTGATARACADRQTAGTSPYSFALRPAPELPEDVYHHKVVVSRRGEVLQTLSLRQDELVQSAADLAGATFGTIDFDCDGDDDLVLFSSRSAAGDEHGYVLVWPFKAAEQRFATRSEVFYSSKERMARHGPDRRPMLIQVLHGVDPATLDSTDEFPILLRRGSEIVDFIDNRELVWFSEEGPDPSTSFIDANFDGHDDLFLRRSHCTGNCYYAFWLFDPMTHRFVHDAALSALANPDVDTARREIVEFHHRGVAGADHRIARYRFVDGHLQKTWESEQTDSFSVPVPVPVAPALQGLVLFHRAVRVLKDSKMSLACEAFVDIESDEVVALVSGEKASCDEGTRPGGIP